MVLSFQHGESKTFLCKCSFLEIYNEQIFDLLDPSSNILHLRESLKTGVYVAGLSEQVVSDASGAYEVSTVVLCPSCLKYVTKVLNWVFLVRYLFPC